jgi:hypothetical protein
MKMKTVVSQLNKWLVFAIGLFATFCLVVVPQVAVAMQDQGAIASVKSCLPPSPAWLGLYEFDVVGRVSNPNPQATGNRSMKEFYLLDVKSPWEENDTPWQTLIGVDTAGECFGYLGQNAMNVTLTAFIPEDLANALAYQKFSHWALQPEGKARIEALLMVEVYEDGAGEATSPEPAYIAPEDAWALRKLGYRIPDEVQVLKTMTPYQF